MSNHVFFRMAQTGRSFGTSLASKIILFVLMIVLAIVFMMAGQVLGALLLKQVAGAGLLPGVDPTAANPANFGPAAQGILLATLFFITAVLTFLWVIFYERRSLASFGFGAPLAGLLKFLRGGLMATLAMAAIAYGLTAAGMAEMSPASIPASWTAIIPLLVLILGWTVQGSTEEIVARGLLFQSFGARYGLILALLVSCAFFSFMHGQNPNTKTLFFINLAFYSAFVCFYALREASLWGVCGFHAFWNFTQGDVFGFAVSGMQFGTDKLMTVTPTGPDLYTGGATGPEGGLATTIVLALCAVAVLILVRPDANSKALADAATHPAEGSASQ